MSKETYRSIDAQGHSHELTNVSADPTWSDVRAVEFTRDASGRLLSVVNHRERSFETRRNELLEQTRALLAEVE